MRDLRRKLRTPASAAVVLAAACCLAYAADAGHGFIKDDFRWIRETRVESIGDVGRLFRRTDGFYRPLVSLTFSANSAAGGLEPRAYGLTNLFLLFTAGLLMWSLGRRLGLPAGAALAAAGIWAFNFHGINMAVLWISGRTALVVTVASLAAAIAFVRGRHTAAGICCLLAMLAKEEAVLLPCLFASWSVIEGGGSPATRAATAARRSWPCVAALGAYLGLRLQTDAFWPASAPSYYRLTFDPAAVAGNLLQYADRALTWPAFAALAIFAASPRLRLDPGERRIAAIGAAWLVWMFAITVFVPARSSLYAVLPSVGSALAAGAVAAAALRAAPVRAEVILSILALLPLVLQPIYWRRNERWVRLADVSSQVLAEVRSAADASPGTPLVLLDDPSERFNLDAAFGSLFPDAAALFLPGTTAVIGAENAPPRAIVLRLRNGRLIREN